MQIKEEELSEIRKKHRNERIVFASGGFDLTHAGHALFLEKCKKLGTILVVGIASDATRRQERGLERPILGEQLRAKMVDSLKPVDYTFMLTRLAKPNEHPLAPLEAIFENLCPDVWAMNDDGTSMRERLESAAKHGFPIHIFPKNSYPPEFQWVSTTAIIDKIKG